LTDIEILSAKARTFLGTAELAMSAGDYDSCASRCYYAMFLMAEAALLTKNLTASSHKGVISLFGEHFARTEIIESHLGKVLNRAYDTRIVGDYGMDTSVAQDEAEELLEAAKGFVRKVKNYLDQWAQKEGGQ
jgi:uncharacterized protein (UPF0332 family)